MTAPLQFDGLASARLPAGPLHLAIGMFDGVHLGHRATIEPAVRAAQERKGVSAVLTFWPHPSALFRPGEPTRLIQDRATKAKVLGQAGIDAVITEAFTTELAGLPAGEFLPWLKQKLPTLKAVYVGANFRFGNHRRGDARLLEESGRALQIAVQVAQPKMVGGEQASSTRIRAHLLAGEIEQANALLGYPYFAEGPVTSGKRLGRTIGFPTLNLNWAPQLQPKFGVYAVNIRGAKSGAALPGVANYGVRPTVENTSAPKLEVHVLGPCPFDAGDHITVEWLYFIRPEAKFANVEELRIQIAHDRTRAGQLLAAAI